MPPFPFIRLGSCCNLVKRSWNLRRNTVRSLAYTTCSDVSKKDTETLDQWKRERGSALLSVPELKESGFKHDLETYMSVVRLVCHCMNHVSSDNFFNDIVCHPSWEIVSFEISDDLFEALMEEKLVKAVEALIEVYAGVGMCEDVIVTLASSGIMVSTETGNSVLFAMTKSNIPVYTVESVYRQLKTNGLIPNVDTYNILMVGLCRKGYFKEAWKFILQMEEAGVKPAEFFYSTYIYGLCTNGLTDLAFKEVKYLWDSDKPVDMFAYASLIRSFLNRMNVYDAEEVFLDMKLREDVPHAYGLLIAGCCQEADIVKAWDICKEMESRGIETDHVTVRLIMQYLGGFGRFYEALGIFKLFMEQPRSRVFLDGALFKIAIEAACKLGKMDDAMGLVEEMKIKPDVMQHLNSKTYTIRS